MKIAISVSTGKEDHDRLESTIDLTLLIDSELSNVIVLKKSSFSTSEVSAFQSKEENFLCISKSMINEINEYNDDFSDTTIDLTLSINVLTSISYLLCSCYN